MESGENKQKILKNFQKPIDKDENICYNEDTKEKCTKENKKTTSRLAKTHKEDIT